MEEGEFLEKMEIVDQQLGQEGIAPHQRQFEAWFRLARNYEGPVLGANIDYSAYAEYEGPNLFKKMGEWYKARYGSRFNIPTVVGQVPVVVRGEIYLIRIPFIIGRSRLENLPSRDINEELLKSMTLAEIKRLESGYKEGYALVYEVDDFVTTCMDYDDGVVKSSGLTAIFQSAIGDRDSALRCFEARPPDCPNACYHAQQYVEKMLKGFLLLRKLAGTDAELRTRFGHNLRKTLETCVDHTPAFVQISNEVGLLNNIKPGIRYGSNKITSPIAVETVWASLRAGSFVARQISGLPPRDQAVEDRVEYWVAIGRLFRNI